mmetsp:Transcript_124735/g.219627  ORF Transcript_124735/g.219627 Transcript_124735/m.219627 type:complete len:749 (-) Transcript_124735:253-2499(-)
MSWQTCVKSSQLPIVVTIEAGPDVHPAYARSAPPSKRVDSGCDGDRIPEERPSKRLHSTTLDEAITAFVETDRKQGPLKNKSSNYTSSKKPALPPLLQQSVSPKKGRPRSRSCGPRKGANMSTITSLDDPCFSDVWLTDQQGFQCSPTSEAWLAADLTEVPFERPTAMDTDRVFVWRSNEWHPVSPFQDYQIKTHLASGAQVFEISEGSFEWTIDTTPKDGWVQISKTTGKRRAMKCQQMTDSLGPRIGVPNVSNMLASPFTPTPRGDEYPYDFEIEYDETQLITRFREEWDSLLKSVNDNAKDQDRPITQLREDDLVSAWLASSGEAGLEYKDLIVQSIADAFLKMDLKMLFNGCRSQRIGETEWLHYWLLENQAPSFHALSQVNEKLLKWRQYEPEVLSQLLDLFLRTADGREDAQITAAQMRSAAQEWLSQDGKRCEMRNQSIDYLKEFLSSEETLDEDEMLTYYEYLNHMIGRKKVKVQLYQYDMSGGKARWMSLYLLGQQMEGVWHTSIVVHGKEYWYGGRVFESEIGETPFGTPTKIVDLHDHTMRTADDFRSHMGHELAHIFTVDAYDILDCNCNHFTDAACRFLLNSHIPRDILMQPELVKNSWALKILRPMLNSKLGQFGNSAETTGKAFVQDHNREDDWHAIQKDTLVVWEHEEGWTRIARVIAKRGNDTDSCALKWLDLHTGELKTQFRVKKTQVRKLSQWQKPCNDNQVAGRHRRASDPMVGGTFGARYHTMGYDM